MTHTHTKCLKRESVELLGHFNIKRLAKINVSKNFIFGMAACMNSTIAVLEGDVIRVSEKLNELENKLKERNTKLDAIDKLMKQKGAKYYYCDETGKEELKRLYHELELNTIEEVHFKCNKLIVDVDLKQDSWHGINIWMTKLEQTPLVIEIKCPSEIRNLTWDVSGRDAPDISNYRLIKERNPGDNGLWGIAGESGGNIQIDALKVSGSSKLHIHSNGGKGGRGEDGKNGEDGKDGETIDNLDEKKWFEGQSVEKEFNTKAILCHAEIKEYTNLVKPWPENSQKYFHKVFYDQMKRKYELVKGMKVKSGVSLNNMH